MTLSQTSILTKQIITISTFAVILGLGSFIGYKVWMSYYLAHLPPVEEKPDMKFGTLPLPDFPQGTVSSSNYSYSLDTVTGGLPKVGIDPGFEKVLKVYFVVQSSATLLAPDKSAGLAEKFAISSPPQIQTDTKYRFSEKGKTLDVDLDTGNFVYNREATISAKETLGEDNKLVPDFQNILGSLGVLKEDLKKGRTKVTLLKAAGNTLVSTDLRVEAQAAQISLWPAPIDKKQIFTPDFNKSLINAVILSNAGDIENYISLEFSYYPIDTTTFATYPIKSSEEAYEDLKSGKGAVVVPPLKPEVSITSIYMGYFLGHSYSPYLQPIFIFEGPNFVAYVSAIRTEPQSPAPAK